MNPPFEKQADLEHVRYAFENNLKPCGRLVALMSAGAEFRQDKKATAFRAWLKKHGGQFKKVPAGSFKTSDRSTGVNAVAVIIDKKGAHGPCDARKNKKARPEGIEGMLGLARESPFFKAIRAQVETDTDTYLKAILALPQDPKKAQTQQSWIKKFQHPDSMRQLNDERGTSHKLTGRQVTDLTHDPNWNLTDKVTQRLTIKGVDWLHGRGYKLTPPKPWTPLTDAARVQLEALTGANNSTTKTQDGKPDAKALLTFKAGDIPLSFATRVHNGISHDPERRGKQTQQDYMDEMQSLIDEVAPFVTPENEAQIKAALQAYKVRYLKLYSAYLEAKGRTMSSMITGAARFPVARNNKRLDIERNRLDEFISWAKPTRAKIIKEAKHKPGEVDLSMPVHANDPEALSKLGAKLKARQERQEWMKASNKIIKRKKLTDAQRTKQLIAMGHDKDGASFLLSGDFAGRPGYPPYELSNNNAQIKRLKGRIAELERDATRDAEYRAQASPEEEGRRWSFEGGELLNNTDAGRVQILFDAKPDTTMRRALKSSGWRWAPSQPGKPWQRQRTNNAMSSARTILGGDIPYSL